MAESEEAKGTQPRALSGEGLWAGVLSSGRCALESAAMPQQAVAAAGDILLGGGAMVLRPLSPCHWLLVRLTGAVPRAFLAGLGAPRLVDGSACPGAAELLARLDTHLPAAEASRLAYALLCGLGAADEPPRALPPLAAEALQLIQTNYNTLYGVEELSEALGVSKCHLVRVFSAAVGISPGRYLTRTRIEAVKQLLLEGEHNLETAAALCGFSGAGYLCRVFKRETGLTPAAWRAANTALPRAAYALPRQDEIYV